MKFSPLQSIAVILLAVLVAGWSELYFPVRESLRLDVIRLGIGMYGARVETDRMRRSLPQMESHIEELGASVEKLTSQFAAAFTSEVYIVVNPANNRLSMRRGRAVLLDAAISTGSNDSLMAGKRKWVFETPRGILSVVRKKKDPVWYKPDWAFLERGESVPGRDSPLRLEKGVLGAYLLDLGGGIMIHGTPYENLLGQNVTHGCIRTGKEDLQVLYDSVPVGTKVYIY